MAHDARRRPDVDDGERARELAAIYQHIPGILFYIAVEPDGEFRFLSMSDAGLAATGLGRDQIVGALVGDVIPAVSRDLVLSNYREAIRSGRTVRWKEVSEYPAGRKIGDVAVTPLYDGNGVATHLVGIVHDITERERLEQTIQALRDEAHERERQERTVELERRTAQLSRLASDLTLAEQHAREQLATVLHDGLQQLLVSASLDLERRIAREARPGVPPDPTLVQVRISLEQAIAAARSLSLELFPPVLHTSGLPAALRWLANQTRAKYGLHIDVSADAAADSARRDVRTLLFESVRELVFNAVKHAGADRVTVRLTLEADDTLCIVVEDRGVGFDPGDLGQRESGGWGLFSIRERLALLGGRLEIDSAPGRGARFRLLSPRGSAQTAAGGTALHDAAPSDPAHGAAGRPLRILLADDHAQVRRAFRDLLEQRRELRVVGEAADGLEAIAQAQALGPDVILMDVSMPNMDGIAATRRIRAEAPFIEILGLSTQPRGEDAHPIEEAGAAGFFTKGVDTERLVERLLGMQKTAATRPTLQAP